MDLSLHDVLLHAQWSFGYGHGHVQATCTALPVVPQRGIPAGPVAAATASEQDAASTGHMTDTQKTLSPAYARARATASVAAGSAVSCRRLCADRSSLAGMKCTRVFHSCSREVLAAANTCAGLLNSSNAASCADAVGFERGGCESSVRNLEAAWAAAAKASSRPAGTHMSCNSMRVLSVVGTFKATAPLVCVWRPAEKTTAKGLQKTHCVHCFCCMRKGRHGKEGWLPCMDLTGNMWVLTGDHVVVW